MGATIALKRALGRATSLDRPGSWGGGILFQHPVVTLRDCRLEVVVGTGYHKSFLPDVRKTTFVLRQRRQTVNIGGETDDLLILAPMGVRPAFWEQIQRAGELVNFYPSPACGRGRARREAVGG